MPLIVTVPLNTHVAKTFGPYRRALNVMDRKETAVQRQLRRGGLASYEPTTQATLLALTEVSRSPRVFLDIGAHMGLYSALVSNVFGDAVRAIAFEPTPTTAALARRLSSTNSLGYEVVELAMSSAPGTATLHISDKAETSNSLSSGWRDSSEQVTVAVTTIDDYCLANGVSPSVIKVDVETLEPHVLRGGLLTIAESRPSIVFEMLPGSDKELNDSTLALLGHLGYHLYRFTGDGWVETNPASHRAHLTGRHRDWLLSPEPLGEDFTAALARWESTIVHCTEETNLLVDGGSAPPKGWDAPYEVPPSGPTT